MKSIKQATLDYLDSVVLARSPNTARTYRNAVNLFLTELDSRGIQIESADCKDLPTEAIAWFAQALKQYAPATERLYLTAATGFFEYLAAESLAEINLPRLKLLIRQRARRTGNNSANAYP